MARPANERGARLSPADHVALLIELLQRGTPDQARRWLHALLRVPAEEREALVQAFERRVEAEYGERSGAADAFGQTLQVRYPPEQREGYVEERVVEYVHVPPERVKKGRARRRSGWRLRRRSMRRACSAARTERT
jgi:hypothetical protein